MDLTNNPGILPIKIQDSYIIKEYYTYTHHLNLSKLEEEITAIEIITKSIPAEERITIYDSNINIILQNVKDKLSHLIVDNKRIKRGLINGLGTAISWITGNMDANDKEKYDEWISQIERKEITEEHDINKQITLSKQLVDEFNEDIKVMNENSRKITTYLTESNDTMETLKIEQKYTMISVNLILIQNRVEEISESVEMCKINSLHSSILSSRELKTITEATKTALISDNIGILWELAKVHCSLTENQIHYFIQLPSKSSPKETFFLLSHPTQSENELVTIIPERSFIILEDSEILSSKECTLLLRNYYCNYDDLKIVTDDCVKHIFQKESNKACKKIATYSRSFIKYVYVINAYVSYNVPSVLIKSKNKMKTVSLYNCSLIMLNKNEEMQGKGKPQVYFEIEPTFVSFNDHLDIVKTNLSFEELHAINLKNEDVGMSIEPIDEHVNNFIIMGFSVSFIIIIIITLYLYYKKRDTIRLFFSPLPSSTTAQRETTSVPLRYQVPVFAGAPD